MASPPPDSEVARRLLSRADVKTLDWKAIQELEDRNPVPTGGTCSFFVRTLSANEKITFAHGAQTYSRSPISMLIMTTAGHVLNLKLGRQRPTRSGWQRTSTCSRDSVSSTLRSSRIKEGGSFRPDRTHLCYPPDVVGSRRLASHSFSARTPMLNAPASPIPIILGWT